MSNVDLMTRLDALESRFALERLIGQYTQGFDSQDEAMLRGIWHDDAKLSLGATFGAFEGVEEIMRSARSNWTQMPHMHHWMANPIDRYRGRSRDRKSCSRLPLHRRDDGPDSDKRPLPCSVRAPV